MLLVLLILFSAFCISAQKHDNIWLLGYAGGSQSPVDDYFGLSILKFDAGNHFSIENNQTSNLNFAASNSSICDSLGNLLFYSNGERIYNNNHELVLNSGGLNAQDQFGASQPQGVLSLPMPGHPNEFMVFISETKYFSQDNPVGGWRIYKNLLDMNANNGSGQLIYKKTQLIEDTLESGQITSVKHANGRDWWILIPESYSNRYFTLLLDPAGVTITDSQSIGIPSMNGLGQAVFAPDGSKYARVNGTTLSEPNSLYLYDFDRCTGKLSNPLYFTFENNGLGQGGVFSKNSRFFYAMDGQKVWQYDLWEADVAASKTLVGEWDGYIWEQHFYTTFAIAQLAPDGKIYISTTGSTPFLHVIEYPDRKGVACTINQRAVELPNLNVYSIPNHPNFRLGPIDDSSCDTLGLDNHPLSNFRWEQEDSLSPLQIIFNDLSSYEPLDWHWDFGDLSISQDTSPVHKYDSAGIYQVCLTVSNQYSSDTYCQTLYLGVSAQDNPLIKNQIGIMPNPFKENLFVLLSASLRNPVFRLYDQVGQLIEEVHLDFGITEIRSATLPVGIYFWEVTSNHERVKSGKCIKAFEGK